MQLRVGGRRRRNDSYWRLSVHSKPETGRLRSPGAYYAAYHSVIAVLESRAGVNRRRWDHSQLQAAFRREFGAKGFLFSIRDSGDFDKLYEDRLIADYERLEFRRAAAANALSVASGLTARIRRIVDDR